MASVSPLFNINNQNAYTGENWQQHPVLLVKNNDEQICEFPMSKNTTFKFGRSWTEEPRHKFMDNDQEINFVTLTGSKDLTVSALVASADNIDNKSVVFTVHKDAAFTGWPVNYLGTEKREVTKNCEDKVRTMTMSREDNRVFQHQIGRKQSYTFQVKWPPILTRQMTQVNTEAPETQECVDPPQTFENDQTLDYVPPEGSGGAGGAGGPGRVGGAGGAGGVGGAGGADKAVDDLDEQTIQKIFKQINPTKLCQAWTVYALHDKNEAHVLELINEAVMKMEQLQAKGERLRFGEEVETGKIWNKWAKEEANKHVYAKYFPIAQRFNSENKDKRPQRRKRKAEDTRGRTRAEQYLEGDNSD